VCAIVVTPPAPFGEVVRVVVAALFVDVVRLGVADRFAAPGADAHALASSAASVGRNMKSWFSHRGHSSTLSGTVVASWFHPHRTHTRSVADANTASAQSVHNVTVSPGVNISVRMDGRVFRNVSRNSPINGGARSYRSPHGPSQLNVYPTVLHLGLVVGHGRV
jgi:hypothetical protein